MAISLSLVICRLESGKASIGHICNEIQRIPRKIQIRFMLKSKKYQNNKKNNIKTEVNKINDKELHRVSHYYPYVQLIEIFKTISQPKLLLPI